MSPETNETTQFPEYPVNLFDESRDHANLWDISALWSPDLAQPRSENNLTLADEE